MACSQKLTRTRQLVVRKNGNPEYQIGMRSDPLCLIYHKADKRLAQKNERPPRDEIATGDKPAQSLFEFK